jgi:transcriptional regulator with XRE-family HTH domain
MSIAKRIATERMALAMTQEELAKLIGTYQPVVSLWEAGKQEPSLTSSARLAKAFDVTLDYLVFGTK